MNKTTAILTFALSTPCCNALAAPELQRISAPAGSVVILPSGHWQPVGSAQGLSVSGSKVQLALASTVDSYRFQNGNQELEIVKTECPRKIGGIFDDCIDGLWEGVGFKNGAPNWAIKQQGDNWVLDIAFNSNVPFSIESGALSDPDTPHEWVDIRAFAAGTLSFDLKVVSFGNNLNGFEVGIGGAAQPLATKAIYPLKAEHWQSYSIELKEFIEQGVTLEQVQQGFVLKTATGEYEGVHLQLDNIRLNAPIPEPMDWALL